MNGFARMEPGNMQLALRLANQQKTARKFSYGHQGWYRFLAIGSTVLGWRRKPQVRYLIANCLQIPKGFLLELRKPDGSHLTLLKLIFILFLPSRFYTINLSNAL